MADTPRNPERRMKGVPSKHMSLAAAKRAAAALRAQLHEELESKRVCAYKQHECSQLTLEGYDYCLRHILEDKNAPYRQCGYVFPNNRKRCHLPAAKVTKDDNKDFGYCMEHALKTHLCRMRASFRPRPPATTESLVASLSHHVKPLRGRAPPPGTGVLGASSSSSHGLITYPARTRSPTPENEVKHPRVVDPFLEIDAMSILNSGNDILDQASESESDVEPAYYSNVWHDAHVDSSDNESIDSEQEDPLKHAGVYTAEEVTLVTRDKLMRLQQLYLEQLNYLEYMLRERRRKYLAALKKEKETLASIHDTPRETPKEKRLYNKLKALNHYERKAGVEAVLNRRCRELRLKALKNPKVDPNAIKTYNKCIFTEGGVKCGERTLPVAKYCRKHILHDPNQVLFKRCGRMKADIECNEPVAAIFKDATCVFHMDLAPMKCYADMKREDDSDLDDSTETKVESDDKSNFEHSYTHHTYSYSQHLKHEELANQLFEDIHGGGGLENDGNSMESMEFQESFVYGTGTDESTLTAKEDTNRTADEEMAAILMMELHSNQTDLGSLVRALPPQEAIGMVQQLQQLVESADMQPMGGGEQMDMEKSELKETAEIKPELFENDDDTKQGNEGEKPSTPENTSSLL